MRTSIKDELQLNKKNVQEKTNDSQHSFPLQAQSQTSSDISLRVCHLWETQEICKEIIRYGGLTDTSGKGENLDEFKKVDEIPVI